MRARGDEINSPRTRTDVMTAVATQFDGGVAVLGRRGDRQQPVESVLVRQFRRQFVDIPGVVVARHDERRLLQLGDRAGNTSRTLRSAPTEITDEVMQVIARCRELPHVNRIPVGVQVTNDGQTEHATAGERLHWRGEWTSFREPGPGLAISTTGPYKARQARHSGPPGDSGRGYTPSQIKVCNTRWELAKLPP